MSNRLAHNTRFADVANSDTSSPGIIDSILNDANLVALIILVVVFVAVILLLVLAIILYVVFCLRRDALYDEAKRNQRLVKKIKQVDENEELSRANRPVRGYDADYQALRGLVSGPLESAPTNATFAFHATPTPTHADAGASGQAGQDDAGEDDALKHVAPNTVAEVASLSADTDDDDDDDDASHTAHLTNAWQVAFRHLLYHDTEGAWATRIQHAMLRLPHDWALHDPHRHKSLESDKERWSAAQSRRARLHQVLPGFFPQSPRASIDHGSAAPRGRPTEMTSSQIPQSSPSYVFPSMLPPQSQNTVTPGGNRFGRSAFPPHTSVGASAFAEADLAACEQWGTQRRLSGPNTTSRAPPASSASPPATSPLATAPAPSSAFPHPMKEL